VAEISITFGQLEAMLSVSHDIASDKRTAFQARLKNLHRLGLLSALGAGRGRAAQYRAGDIVEMALALELSQLGLSPERVVTLLNGEANRYPMAMCVRMAAREIQTTLGPEYQTRRKLSHPRTVGEDAEDQKLLSMFLYFDPTALQPLVDQKFTGGEDLASETFFYGGIGIVRENLTAWTSGIVRRLALINVTTVMRDLTESFGVEFRAEFLDNVISWATQVAEGGGDGDSN
jgi:hypothetical protein